MRSALLLIGIQNDYFPGGKLPLAGSEDAAGQAAEALRQCRLWNIPAVHIQHVSIRPGSTFFLPDSEGAQIHESVSPLPTERVYEKHFPNSFRETPLLEHLRSNGIEALAIAGMMTSICVDATARAAFDHGLQIFLLGDAMATCDLVYNGETIPASQVQGAFLAALANGYGRVCSVDEFMQMDFLQRIGAAKQPNVSAAGPQGEDRRRSRRQQSSVPLLLLRKNQTLTAETENISAHGALVNSPESFQQGAQIVVVNEKLDTKTEGWVVWSRPASQPGRFTLGIEFYKAVATFWGSDYAP